MTHERITDLSDPRLDVFRNLKPCNALRDGRLFVAEGPTVVERLLRSRFVVRSVLVTDRKFPGFESRLPNAMDVYRVTDAQAREIVGFDFHAGVMACAVREPSPPIASAVNVTGPSVIVAGDRITDPENVGALIRIASAFGATAAMFGPGSTDPFSRRVLRVSMGNVLFLPILEPPALPDALNELQSRHGYEVCALHLDAAAETLSAATFKARTVLVFGNEYDGLSDEVLAVGGRRLTIPMLNGTDSLNVAVSAGIAMHQYRAAWPAAG